MTVEANLERHRKLLARNFRLEAIPGLEELSRQSIHRVSHPNSNGGISEIGCKTESLTRIISGNVEKTNREFIESKFKICL